MAVENKKVCWEMLMELETEISKFTYGKTFILEDVMHNLEIRKNLVSNFFLNKDGFVQVYG